VFLLSSGTRLGFEQDRNETSFTAEAVKRSWVSPECRWHSGAVSGQENSPLSGGE